MNDEGRAVGTAQDLLMHVPPNARWDDGFRPVDVDFDPCGRLIVSSDGSGNPRRGDKMVRIEYTVIPQRVTDEPTPGPSQSPSGLTTSDPTTGQPSQGLQGNSTMSPTNNSTEVPSQAPTNAVTAPSPSQIPTGDTPWPTSAQMNDKTTASPDPSGFTPGPTSVLPQDVDPQSDSSGVYRQCFGCSRSAIFLGAITMLWLRNFGG